MIDAAIKRWRDELDRLERENRSRSLVLPRGIDFTSNDYLGLAGHPTLREALVAALERDGMVGAGGSRLLRGHHEEHARLEAFAADFFGSEKALYFGAGFVANLAILTSLADRHDAIVFDERVHASIKEGAHASRAERYRARHNDLQAFAAELNRAKQRGARQIFIAVESVYSMDGDLAPLSDLSDLAREFDAILIVDEAHATGIFGPRGRGLAEGLDGVVTLHTCSKALGVFGALVCGPAEMIDYMINKARPFIYSTAPPPCLAAAVVRALQLIDEEPWRRKRVLELARFAHEELSLNAPFAGSPIVPIIVGDDEAAVSLARSAQDGGFDVRAIRPPTVPEGTARLRVSINAGHSEEQIRALAATIRAARAR